MPVANQLEIKLTELQVLKGALVVLDNEEAWTKGKFARDEDGETCSPISPKACKFCLLGAMRKAANNDSGLVISTMKLVEFVNDIPVIAQWNDEPDRKFVEVVGVINKTIESIKNV